MDRIVDDEQLLINEILAGRSGAARKFYEKFHRQLRIYVILRTKCVEDAEEIIQDIFLSAIESLKLYSGRSKLITWIYGIARHEISDYYRKKRVKTLVMSRVPMLAELLKDDDWRTKYDKFAVREQVDQALRRLLPRYAKILKMKYLEGWSVRDMAKELGESFKATETALFRARKAFAIEWRRVEGTSGL